MPKFRKRFSQQPRQFKQLSLRVPQATVLHQRDKPQQKAECGKNTPPPLILKSHTFLFWSRSLTSQPRLHKRTVAVRGNKQQGVPETVSIAKEMYLKL